MAIEEVVVSVLFVIILTMSEETRRTCTAFGRIVISVDMAIRYERSINPKWAIDAAVMDVECAVK